MKNNTNNSISIRKRNRKDILKIIRKEQTLEQSTIIKNTGLSKQTVNTIIIDLIKNGIIIEHKLGTSTIRGGRKPMILKFNPKAYFLVGMTAGENNLRCGLTDLNGEILLEKTSISRLEDEPLEVSNRIVDLFFKVTDEAKIERKKILGLGIGLPGIIDFNEGIVKFLTRHNNWKEFPLKTVLKKRIKVPIILDNEANVRALGEKWFGLASGAENFISVMIRDDGIGAGVVINGEIHRGKNFLTGEIGHILFSAVNNKGLKNFENYLGYEYINEICGLEKTKEINKGEGLKYIFEKYNNGDSFVMRAMRKVLFNFGVLLAALVCTYDVELIIIQGSYAVLNDNFYKETIKFVNNIVFPEIKKNLKILRSPRSKEMGVKGSASMVLDVIDI